MTTPCGRYLGDNDGTCPQLRCVRLAWHRGPCDNVNGDDLAGPDAPGWRERNALRLAEQDVADARRTVAHARDRLAEAERRVERARAAVEAIP